MNKLEERLHLQILQTVSTDEKAKNCVEILKDVAVKFTEWKDKLTPAQKCTVHPPAGLGGGRGIYTIPTSELLEKFITHVYGKEE